MNSVTLVRPAIAALAIAFAWSGVSTALAADVKAAGMMMFWVLTGQSPPQGAPGALDPRTVDADHLERTYHRTSSRSSALPFLNALRASLLRAILVIRTD